MSNAKKKLPSKFALKALPLNAALKEMASFLDEQLGDNLSAAHLARSYLLDIQKAATKTLAAVKGLPAVHIDGHHLYAGRWQAQRCTIERLTLDIPAIRHAEALAFLRQEGWTILGDNARGTIVCEKVQGKFAPDSGESHPAY